MDNNNSSHLNQNKMHLGVLNVGDNPPAVVVHSCTATAGGLFGFISLSFGGDQGEIVKDKSF